MDYPGLLNTLPKTGSSIDLRSLFPYALGTWCRSFGWARRSNLWSLSFCGCCFEATSESNSEPAGILAALVPKSPSWLGHATWVMPCLEITSKKHNVLSSKKYSFEVVRLRPTKYGAGMIFATFLSEWCVFC